MREILFRGKRIDNGEWVIGSLVNDEDVASFICPDVSDVSYGDNGNRMRIGCWYRVDPSTVGQYTGLTDKNGKRIFEGDIGLLDDEKGVVNYGTGCFCVRLKGPDYLSRCNPAIDIVLNEYPGFEIIGNIHDNHELLEGGTDNA